MSDTALLAIDVHVGFFESDPPVEQAREMLDRIKTLITKAKNAGIPVIFVQHVEALEFDGPIHPAIAALKHDAVIDKMTPDSFFETDLRQTLEKLSVNKLIIVGFQTEYCIDTTTRRARSMGYGVTLVKEAHSTFTFDDAVIDAPTIIAHHNHVLAGFATLKPFSEIDFAALE